tara:strand:- start:197 stop:814 length:618 start_codon:yes stop_codon:yes gene_type:complete
MGAGIASAESDLVYTPKPVELGDFVALTAQSPFSRALNLSDSLILTGIATLDTEKVATLLNKETNETYVVSSQLNAQGWKMVELKVDDDLEKVAATVSVEGGEVVTVRYAEWQLKPGEARPGGGVGDGAISPGGTGGKGKGGKGGDGERRGPPPEMREKMMTLSEDQRGKLFQKMMELREKSPDMPREERGKIMSEMVEKMTQKK